MIDLGSIKGRHSGQCIAVLGGGPSLLRDLQSVPQEAVLIGVNQHAMLMNLDYLVFQDREIHSVVREADAPLCTHHRDLADIYTGIVPDYGLSGATALWIADYFDAARIYLCGCDSYKGTRRYWHSKPGDMRPTDGYSGLDVWEGVKRHLQHPGRVVVPSGPIREIFNAG